MTNRLAAVAAGIGILAGAFLSPAATGSELTSVMSSFDAGDPFDGALSVRWNWQLRKSLITRETVCNNVPGLCPGENKTVLVKELESKRSSHSLDIELRGGIYKDVELFVVLPLVLADETDLSFASGVDHSKSSVDPVVGSSLFRVPNSGRARSGFGDLSVGLRYAPMAQWRDPYYPNWLLAFTYTAPTGGTRKATNSAVGKGTHTLKFETAASRRILFVEPYFSLFGSLHIPSSGGLYKNYGETQKHVDPGHEVGLALGTEFFPWDVPRADGKKGQFASIDVGFSAKYQFQGRGYTDLSDAFGSSACNTDPACGLTGYTRVQDNEDAPRILKMDGITDVGPFGTFSVWGGFNVQPIEYVELSFRFTYSRETAHHLTYADVGEDLDGGLPGGTAGVDFKNSMGLNEYNPVYNAEVDDPGRRFRSEGANLYGILLQVTGKL
jgi:hypothetical protein